MYLLIMINSTPVEDGTKSQLIYNTDYDFYFETGYARTYNIYTTRNRQAKGLMIP